MIDTTSLLEKHPQVYNEQACRGLMQRGTIACFIYVFAWLLLEVFYGLSDEYPRLMVSGYILFGGFGAFRALLSMRFDDWYNYDPVLWYHAYQIAVLGLGISWMVLSIYLMLDLLPEKPLGYLLALMTSGYLWGGVMTLFSHLRFQRLYIFILTVPVMVVCVWVGDTSTLFMGLLYLMASAYLYSGGKRIHDQYYDSLAANQRLEVMATTDQLTGIPNRRAFNNYIDTALRYAGRNNQRLLVMMLDVDHFKGYNDHYGHGSGDSCLQAIACAIKSRIQRSTDLVARYGGEEFIAVVSDVTYDSGVGMVQSILDVVTELSLPHENSSVSPNVTISIGAVIIKPKGDEDPDHIIEQADRALYRAKSEGRNKAILIDLDNESDVALSPN